MKRFAFLAIAALALVGCAKEIDRVQETGMVKTHTVTIKAGIESTRTAYSESGKFSWLPGDRIGVLCSNGQEFKVFGLTTEDGGYEAAFSGSVEDGYLLTGYASYPFTEVVDGYACNDFVYSDATGFRIWGSINPDPENPLGSTPLFGEEEETGVYRFKTACGIVKFTVVNAPIDMAYAYLETPSDSEAYLNGWFSMGDNNYLEMANAIYGYHDRYNWNVPTDYNQTMDFYFFTPVGTLPAGTKFELCTSNWAAIESFEFKKDVEVVRNAIVEIEPIELEGAAITSLGTGRFRDNFIWEQAGLTEYAEVEFQQIGESGKKFRIAKPYPGEESGEWFVFDITNPEAVASDPYFVDFAITNEYQGETYTFKPWVRNGDYGYNYSDVRSWQESGLPACIEIGPCYRGDEFYDNYNYAYQIGRDHENNAIEIIFPGCEPYTPAFEVGEEIPLTEDMFSPIATETSEGSIKGLCDNIISSDQTNDWFWHSPWSVAGTYDPVYGIYVDIDLGEGNEVQDFELYFCLRPVLNNHAKHVRVFGSNDKSNWGAYLAEKNDVYGTTGSGNWTKPFDCFASGPVRYIRLAILSTDGNNGIVTDLTDASQGGCTHIAEIKLFHLLPIAEE